MIDLLSLAVPAKILLLVGLNSISPSPSCKPCKSHLTRAALNFSCPPVLSGPCGKVFSTGIRGKLRQSCQSRWRTYLSPAWQTQIYGGYEGARGIRLKVRGGPVLRNAPRRLYALRCRRYASCAGHGRGVKTAAGVDHADNSAHRHGFLTKLLRPVEVGAQLTSAEGCEVRRRCLSLKIRSDPSQRLCQTFIHRTNVWPTSEWNLPVPCLFFFFFF